MADVFTFETTVSEPVRDVGKKNQRRKQLIKECRNNGSGGNSLEIMILVSLFNKTQKC